MVVRVADLGVEPLQQGDERSRVKAGGLVVMAQHVVVGVQVDEGEAAAQGVVNQGGSARNRPAAFSRMVW